MKDENAILQNCGQLQRFWDEDPLHAIRDHILNLIPEIPKPESGVNHNASTELASFCYAWCRANKPEVVIETGVSNGVTTAFILQAMNVNGKGVLWSIDLAPLGAKQFVGCLVPAFLKERWTLHEGRSRRLLPRLLSHLSSLDMFLHDSLHTAKNMAFEFNAAWPKLREGGVLISDDVTFFNHAFEDFVRRDDVVYSAIHEAGFGVAIKG